MTDDALSDIDVRELHTLEDYQACVALQEETWGVGFSERVPSAILRVSQKVGGVTAGAFDARGQMVGFVFGLTGVRNGALVHWSDMLAVRPAWRGKHIGDRLKRYQADRVRALGVRTMLWTFDPLVARNAHFNINRLGAHPVEYVVDMYGATGSTLHGHIPTDRFIAAWEIGDGIPEPGRDGPAWSPADAERIPVANTVGEQGPTTVPLDASIIRVQVPRDSDSIFQSSPELALQWRLSVREAMLPRLTRGFRVMAFMRGTEQSLPCYVLERRPST